MVKGKKQPEQEKTQDEKLSELNNMSTKSKMSESEKEDRAKHERGDCSPQRCYYC